METGTRNWRKLMFILLRALVSDRRNNSRYLWPKKKSWSRFIVAEFLLCTTELETKLCFIGSNISTLVQVTDTFRVRCLSTWSRALWTRFALRRLEKCFVQTTLFSVSQQ